MTEKCEKKVYYSFFKKCIIQFDGFVTFFSTSHITTNDNDDNPNKFSFPVTVASHRPVAVAADKPSCHVITS